MDIIFGPLHQQQVKPLADFAQKNDIRLVVPLPPKTTTYSATHPFIRLILLNHTFILKCTITLYVSSQMLT